MLRTLIRIALVAAGAGVFMCACRTHPEQSWKRVLHGVDSLMAAGDTTRALKTVSDFLQSTSRGRGVDSNTVALTDSLGHLLSTFGQDELAGELYRRALQDLDPRTSADRLARARLQTGYALILAYLAQFDQSQAMIDSALATQKELFGDDNLEIATSLSAQGALFTAEGNYTEAEDAFTRVLAIRRKFLPPDDLALVGPLNNLANAYYSLAQPESLESVYLQALGILEHHRPAKDIEYASVLQNLAAQYDADGDTLKALRTYQDALEILEKSAGGRHPLVATIRDGMATVFYELKRWDEAEAMFRKALSLYYDLGESGDRIANCEGNFGHLLFRESRFDSAEVHLRNSIRLYNASVGPDHPDVTYPHGLLADLFTARKNWSEARAERRIVYEIARRSFLTQYGSLSEDNALAFSGAFRTGTYDYAAVLANSSDMRIDTCRELADLVVMSKGLVQDGALARQNLLRKDLDPRIRILMDSLETLRNRQLQISVRVNKSGGSALLVKELAAAKSDASRLEKRLIEQSPLHHEYLDVPADSIYSALRRLPSGSRVVDYFAFVFYYADLTSEQHYLAAVFSDTGFVACVDLGLADSIDQRIHKYRSYLENPRQAGAALIRDATRDVYRAVWSPLETFVDSAQMVFVCPDGELSLVSFAGLSEDENSYLIEKFPIHYLTTARDLVHQTYRETRGRGIVLLGNPDYGGAVPPLEHAGREVTNVAEAWQAAYQEPIQLLTGKLAGEREFRRWASGARVLYFAAHSADIAVPAAGSRAQELPVDAELPTGILLAEFRSLASDSSPESDGFLTSEEISALDLTRTDLAVLSTCESGGGKLVRGEGVYGLRRSFQMAGARTVISTLWPVDDRSTAELMKHGLFDSTATYPEALQRVCLARIRELRLNDEPPNPFLWAAFTSYGNWKR